MTAKRNWYADDVCTIYDNLNGIGYRIQRTNSGFLRHTNPVYKTRSDACRAAYTMGYRWYFATWHHDTSHQPRRMPERFRGVA